MKAEERRAKMKHEFEQLKEKSIINNKKTPTDFPVGVFS